MILLLKKEL